MRKEFEFPDWLKRALKTFVQAFLGVLIPEVVYLLDRGLDTEIDAIWAFLTPVICSSLAAGISAAWNIIKEKLEV